MYLVVVCDNAPDKKENIDIIPPTTVYNPKSDSPKAFKTNLEENKPTNIVINIRIYTTIVLIAIVLLELLIYKINYLELKILSIF